MGANFEAVRANDLRWRLYEQFGVEVSFDDARALRRAAQSLRRWYRAEHGLSGTVIARDGEGIPRVVRTDGKFGHAVSDREASALCEVAGVCSKHGLAYRTSWHWDAPLFLFAVSDASCHSVAC
jgi:hypothetical protein